MATVEEYAQQIRSWVWFDNGYRKYKGLPRADRNVVFTFSQVAAQFERARYDLYTKGETPGARTRCNELADQVDALTGRLGLQGGFDADHFVPGDPGVYLCNCPRTKTGYDNCRCWVEQDRKRFG